MKTILNRHTVSREENIEIGWIPGLFSGDASSWKTSGLQAEEIRFEDLADSDSNYEKAVRLRSELLKVMANRHSLSFYYSDLMPTPTSRVRSHKSVFPYRGAIFQSGFTQVECFLTETTSYLVGKVDVGAVNLLECDFLARDRRRAFFVLNERENEMFDVKFAVNAFAFRSIAYVNLPYLCGQIAEFFDGVLFYGGNQGVDFENITIYKQEGAEIEGLRSAFELLRRNEPALVSLPLETGISMSKLTKR